jgi:hypothetical protein
MKWGAYVWSACAAGWGVLWVVTGVVQALVVAVGCAACAGLWLIVGEAIGGITREGGNRNEH